jgi:hypothetical protein
MNQTGTKQQTSDTSVTRVTMNLEVQVISVSSVTFGKGITAAAPGSAVGALVVSDIQAAHDEVIRRGITASEMWHGAPFPVEARLPGPDPKRTSYGSFFAFNDPDGNAWLVQEVTTRLSGRI